MAKMHASLIVELPDGSGMFVFTGEVHNCAQIRSAPGERSLVLDYLEGEGTFQFIERLKRKEVPSVGKEPDRT